MRKIAFTVLTVIGTITCATGHRAARQDDPSPSALVFRSDDDALQGCEELGVVAETDGAFRLSESCSCQHPERAEGTDSGAVARAAVSAARLGANAVWVLKVTSGHVFRTHLEDCCYVSGYRAYGVAFLCDEDTLAWHKKHEDLSKK